MNAGVDQMNAGRPQSVRTWVTECAHESHRGEPPSMHERARREVTDTERRVTVAHGGAWQEPASGGMQLVRFGPVQTCRGLSTQGCTSIVMREECRSLHGAQVHWRSTGGGGSFCCQSDR